MNEKSEMKNAETKPAPYCQWMQGVMNSETSSWEHCQQPAVAEVFRSGMSVGVVCETHECAARIFKWETKRPIRSGIA